MNHSKHGETRIDVPIGIAYKENIPQARKVLLEAVQNLQGVAASPPPDVVTFTVNTPPTLSNLSVTDVDENGVAILTGAIVDPDDGDIV